MGIAYLRPVTVVVHRQWVFSGPGDIPFWDGSLHLGMRCCGRFLFWTVLALLHCFSFSPYGILFWRYWSCHLFSAFALFVVSEFVTRACDAFTIVPAHSWLGHVDLMPSPCLCSVTCWRRRLAWFWRWYSLFTFWRRCLAKAWIHSPVVGDGAVPVLHYTFDAISLLLLLYLYSVVIVDICWHLYSLLFCWLFLIVVLFVICCLFRCSRCSISGYSLIPFLSTCVLPYYPFGMLLRCSDLLFYITVHLFIVTFSGILDSVVVLLFRLLITVVWCCLVTNPANFGWICLLEFLLWVWVAVHSMVPWAECHSLHLHCCDLVFCWSLLLSLMTLFSVTWHSDSLVCSCSHCLLFIVWCCCSQWRPNSHCTYTTWDSDSFHCCVTRHYGNACLFVVCHLYALLILAILWLARNIIVFNEADYYYYFTHLGWHSRDWPAVGYHCCDTF